MALFMYNQRYFFDLMNKSRFPSLHDPGLDGVTLTQMVYDTLVASLKDAGALNDIWHSFRAFTYSSRCNLIVHGAFVVFMQNPCVHVCVDGRYYSCLYLRMPAFIK
jgi:hypothetical protein